MGNPVPVFADLMNKFHEVMMLILERFKYMKETASFDSFLYLSDRQFDRSVLNGRFFLNDFSQDIFPDKGFKD